MEVFKSDTFKKALAMDSSTSHNTKMVHQVVGDRKVQYYIS